MEPMRYDPAIYLPDPRLRARIAGLDPVARAALAEALCGNMSTHVLYCVRDTEIPAIPDGTAADAVPVMREQSAEDLAQSIRPDGTIGFVFDGLRVPVALPSLAPALLRLIDGQRDVGGIMAAMAGRAAPAAVERAWQSTYATLNALNRILLAPPP